MNRTTKLLLVLISLVTLLRGTMADPFTAANGLSIGAWTQPTPVEIEIITDDGSRNGVASWIRTAYTSIQTSGSTTTASATVETPGGGELLVSDDYLVAQNDEIVVRRNIKVIKPSTEAFSSRFSLGVQDNNGLNGKEFFMPGVWYKDSQDVSPDHALANDLNAKNVLIREDRLPLPIAAVRINNDVASLVRHKIDPLDGSTFWRDDWRNRIIDERMQYGSMGFVVPSGNRLEAVYQCPGTEGDRTYVGGRGENVWAYRSHPMKESLRHTYQLRFSTSTSSSYAETVEGVWRRAWSEASPNPPYADINKIYEDGVDLLAEVTKEYNGVISVPFSIKLAHHHTDMSGIDTSSQMGFIGKALPAAALLLRAGVQKENEEWIEKATQVIDFWMDNSLYPSDSGVSRTWYNIKADDTGYFWRQDNKYMGHIRITSDGMHGVLAAYRHSGGTRLDWLEYAQRYGDFLLSRQAADGSIAGSFDMNGNVWSAFTNAGYQAVPFLLDLFQAKGDEKYKDAAVALGEFARKEMEGTYHYVGGTPDNPNALDKEAGALALKAFLALHDYTADNKWITAAKQAATFCETWTYSWDLPIPQDDPDAVYPKQRTTLGASLIAVGHSGADMFMAILTYDFYRLYQLTSDAHYRDFALFLEYSTKQLLDWDGELGHSHPGLMSEVFGLSVRRGRGPERKWHPFLSVGILESLVALKEVEGSYSLPRSPTPSPIIPYSPTTAAPVTPATQAPVTPATQAPVAGPICFTNLCGGTVCNEPLLEGCIKEDFESGSGGWFFDEKASTCRKGDFVIGTPDEVTSKGVTTQVCGDHTKGNGKAFFTARNDDGDGKEDVDKGECIGKSKTYSVSQDSTLSIWYFFGQRKGGDDSNDYFALEMSLDGGKIFDTTLASYRDEMVQAKWTQASGYVPANSEVVVRVRVSDGRDRGDLIEGGVDDLRICPQAAAERSGEREFKAGPTPVTPAPVIPATSAPIVATGAPTPATSAPIVATEAPTPSPTNKKKKKKRMGMLRRRNMLF